MNKEIKYILSKMCTYVDIDYVDIKFGDLDWFLQYEWTSENEIDFINWLTDEFRTNNKLRKKLTPLPYKPAKYRAKKYAEMFCWNYGWKTKVEKI